MKPRKCKMADYTGDHDEPVDFQDGSKWKRCPTTPEFVMKVRVLHPDLDPPRRTWQTWRLCFKHLKEFQSVDGKTYVSFKNNYSVQCPVIGFKEPTILELTI